MTASVSSPATPPPSGVYVPVPTFFLPSSASKGSRQVALDIPTQIAHSLHLARSGIKGLVLLGSTGEAVHLSSTERKALFSGVRKGLADEGFPEYPIIAGVLTNSVDDAIEELHNAKAAGSGWGMVIAPGYFGAVVDQQNIIDWYRTVADESPIPILLYHYPGVLNNIVITPSTITTIAAHPNIVGIKMSHGNVSHHLQISLSPFIDHSTFSLFSGFGQQLFPIVSLGGAGVIDGLGAFFPKTVVRLYNLSEAVAQGEGGKDLIKEIGVLQFAVSSAEELCGAYGIVGIKEAVFRILELGTLEGGRLPLAGNIGAENWEKWTDTIARVKALEDSL